MKDTNPLYVDIHLGVGIYRLDLSFSRNIYNYYIIISLAILMKITFTKNGVPVYYTQTIENPTQAWQIMN